MIAPRQLLHSSADTWPQIRWAMLLGIILCGAMLTAGRTTEKLEPSSKSDNAAPKAKKPPLGTVTILVPKKEFETVGPNKALKVTFEDLDIERVLNTKKLSLDLPKQMPEWLKKLDGQRIRLRGFMHPQSAFQEHELKRFVLARDTAFMTFSTKAILYHLVEVDLKPGSKASYIDNKSIDVEGIFHIKPMVSEESGEVDRFYQLDDAEVIPTVIKKVPRDEVAPKPKVESRKGSQDFALSSGVLRTQNSTGEICIWAEDQQSHIGDAKF